MDGTTLKVCKNQRINSHKVFKGLAQRGKSSMGWFYGFKLHLVCNEKGELLAFYLTQGNVDDRNPRHIKKLTEKLFGKLFADGIQLFTRLEKNRKGHIIGIRDSILLRKRSIIETINDELKNLCQIEHTRHRSVNNFIINILSVSPAYSFFPKKNNFKSRKGEF